MADFKAFSVIDFQDSHIINKDNIQPMPNPKQLSVLRERTEVTKDGDIVGYEYLTIKNVRVYPRQLFKR